MQILCQVNCKFSCVNPKSLLWYHRNNYSITNYIFKESNDKEGSGEKLSIIVMLIIYFLLGVLVIKLGIDNSRSTQISKEILNELREIKELMIRNKYE
jgi:hypothetical protein